MERTAACFRLLVLLLAGFLAACGAAPPGVEVYDPYEATNRKIHRANVALDRALVRPAAKAYGKVVPDGPAGMINNFAFNFAEPRTAINGVLQGRPQLALDASFRFLINSTVGIFGLFDPATALGIEGQSTDFGQTMHTWGINEGAYMELPLVGPSTARHTVGRVADLFMNPLTYVLPTPEAYIGTASSLAWALDTRDEFSITLDDVLYNSADSYAQARILYLQNRRFKLGSVREEDVFDPYEEFDF